MEDIELLIGLREKALAEKYYLQEIPSNLDNALSEYMKLYRSCDLSTRIDLSKQIRGMEFFFTCYAERMANLVLRTGDYNSLVNGLYSLEFSYYSIDQREVILILSLFDDACEKHSIVYDNIMGNGSKFADFVRTYSKRPLINRNIKIMGYKIIHEKRLPTYKRTW